MEPWQRPFERTSLNHVTGNLENEHAKEPNIVDSIVPRVRRRSGAWLLSTHTKFSGANSVLTTMTLPVRKSGCSIHLAHIENCNEQSRQIRLCPQRRIRHSRLDLRPVRLGWQRSVRPVDRMILPCRRNRRVCEARVRATSVLLHS